MKRILISLSLLLLTLCWQPIMAQQRRPIDNEHPLWLVHVDVWNQADPQKIIDLIPDDIKPYVCMNLSLSCAYDKDYNVYKMPRCAVRTWKSWATVCQQNGLWFTCQPASGGHTHIQDDDLVTFEYFFKKYPNFLGWNYAEQFWGFDEPGDKSSSQQTTRWALFAKLVEMSHKYGGFLTISFCGNIWSHPLNPLGEMKREPKLLEACRKYPEAILWLYKYTTSSCFYNNESVSWSPFVSGLAKNYGVRYDNCGWNGAMDAIFGENNGKKYPVSAGIGTVMEQTGINGGAVWDGPELIWTEDFQNLGNSTVEGYSRRRWGRFPGFEKIWIDMFRKILDGTLHIPSRKEVIDHTKIAIINDIDGRQSSGDVSDNENKYAAWGNLYDGLYKQTDPLNRGNGQWMDNLCYFKKTGRYGTIPVCLELADDLAKSIPVQVKKSERSKRWPTLAKKTAEYDEQYPEISTGDLFVARMGNQLVTYTPYSYLNSKTTAEATIPLQYNTCEALKLNYNKLSSGLIREYADHIDLYLNNFRTDTTALVKDYVTVTGATAEPTYTVTKRAGTTCIPKMTWDEETKTFTLELSHRGPVDVNIVCAGNNERTQTATAPTALDIPQQPAEYHGPIIIEAEDMDYKSVGEIYVNNAGYYKPDMHDFAGNGFIRMSTGKSGSLRHRLTLRQGGEYTITVRYMNTNPAGEMVVSVNGTEKTVLLNTTEKNQWLKASVNATLNEGTNELLLNNVNGVPAYIDQVIYAPAGTEVEKFLVTVREDEHGALTPDKDQAAEGETVTLKVTADEGYQLKELRIVNSVFYSMDKTITIDPNSDEITFTMPDDNVTLQPVFVDVTSFGKLDFSNTLAGAIPEGWVCLQENNETHQYPNTYGQGARTFAGFTGYQGKALYWREEYAEYGRQNNYPLQLEPGEYELRFAMAAWKESPRYKAQILDAATGSAVAQSEVFTAAPNVNGSQSGNVSSAELRTLPFTITKPGKYIVRYTNESRNGYFDEYLLLNSEVKLIKATGIQRVESDSKEVVEIYNVSGVRQSAISRGLNILRMSDGTTRKVLVK